MSVPSLSGLCAGTVLFNQLDHELHPSDRSMIDENMLSLMWNDLNAKVPEGALGLQTILADIESAYDPADADDSTEPKFAGFFRKLTEAFSSELIEAGFPHSDRIPCSWADYERIQKTLQRKWSDKTLLILWGNVGSNFSEKLSKAGAFKKSQIPEKPRQIRAWLSKSKNKVYLDGITQIDLTQLGVRVCPTAINYFKNLQVLNLRFNELRSFSCDLRPCMDLKRLCLSNNKIQKFAPDLSCCSELERLELSTNRLTHFSVNLEACIKLKWVDCSFNRIIEFSSSLKNLKRLETINLTFNKLPAFSDSLLPEKRPKRILLSRNPMHGPRTPPGFRRTARAQPVPLIGLLAPPKTDEARTSPKPPRARGAS